MPDLKMKWFQHWISCGLAFGILVVLSGCPAPPPTTQKAGSAVEFQRLLSIVVPVGTAKEDAQQILRYQEGLRAKEVSVGNFTQNLGQANEKVHKGIHYLHCHQEFTQSDGTLKQINIAFVLENNVVKKVLANEEMVKPKGGSQESL